VLFFVTWPDRVSLLLDQPDEAQARAVAREISEGSEPAECQPFNGVFAAEVFLDEDEDGQPLMVVEPLEHVADALYVLEEGTDDDGIAEVIDLPIAAPVALCGYEMEFDDRPGEVWTCARARHDGDPHHRADDGTEWDDAGD
jgi:hypothetical protein